MLQASTIENVKFVSGLIAQLDAELDIREIRKSQIVMFKNTYSDVDVINTKTQELSRMRYKNHTIAKRKDGRWYARYSQNKKQYSVYGKTQNECLTKLKKALKEAKNKTCISYTFGEWVNKWLELYKIGRIKDTSLNNIKSTLKTHLQSLNDIELSKLTSLRLQEIINTGKSTKIRATIYTVLNDCISKAYKMDLINKNPMLSLIKPKYVAEEVEPLSLVQEQKFEQIALQEGCFNLLMCLYQGVRIGEALALTKEDITNNQIHITKSINKNGITTKPKTKTSQRNIPLFNRTKKILDQFLTREKSNTYTEYRCCEKIFKEIGYSAKSNMTKCLRHTFATRAMEAGIEPKVVQKWMGHSTVDITMKIYTHVRQQFEESEVGRLNDFFDTEKN